MRVSWRYSPSPCFWSEYFFCLSAVFSVALFVRGVSPLVSVLVCSGLVVGALELGAYVGRDSQLVGM